MTEYFVAFSGFRSSNYKILCHMESKEIWKNVLLKSRKIYFLCSATNYKLKFFINTELPRDQKLILRYFSSAVNPLLKLKLL